IIIDRGKVIADGTPEQLKNKAENAGAVLVSVTGSAVASLRPELEKLSEVNRVESVESGDHAVTVRVFPNKGKGGALSAAIFKAAVDKNLTIQELKVEEGRLDELFRQITRSDIEA
ncbi:MAG: ABC transporter ATP-binding protein, partial [Verrucomicrobiae bacterium]|nr:ABC transporter ATP-binding protein [Verrucomicrobiae bacterium]